MIWSAIHMGHFPQDGENEQNVAFLASQDALEVMFVTELLTKR